MEQKHPLERKAENTSGAFVGGLIAGVPLYRIPECVKQYTSFIVWWMTEGRLDPENHDGWGSISGPGVMRGRTEIIEPSTWESLPVEDQAMIQEWAEGIPLLVLYD